MTKNLIFVFFASLILLTGCSLVTGNNKVVHLNTEDFKTKVFDYETNRTWKYEGDKPAIVDFYATWCGPCKQMSPILDEIADEYAGKLTVYKIDTDEENQLSQAFGIESIPTFLLIPVTGKPTVFSGAMPKDELIKAINDVLLK